MLVGLLASFIETFHLNIEKLNKSAFFIFAKDKSKIKQQLEMDDDSQKRAREAEKYRPLTVQKHQETKVNHGKETFYYLEYEERIRFFGRPSAKLAYTRHNYHTSCGL